MSNPQPPAPQPDSAPAFLPPIAAPAAQPFGVNPGFPPPQSTPGVGAPFALPTAPTGSRLAVAALIVSIVDVAVFGIYRILEAVQVFVPSDGYAIFMTVFGLLGLPVFVVSVVLGHMAVAAARRNGGIGRVRAGIAIGTGYLMLLVWLTAMVYAVCYLAADPTQTFSNVFYL